jgi:hypothetical protein
MCVGNGVGCVNEGGDVTGQRELVSPNLVGGPPVAPESRVPAEIPAQEATNVHKIYSSSPGVVRCCCLLWSGHRTCLSGLQMSLSHCFPARSTQVGPQCMSFLPACLQAALFWTSVRRSIALVEWVSVHISVCWCVCDGRIESFRLRKRHVL